MPRLRTALALAVSSSALVAPCFIPAATAAVAPIDNRLELVSVANPEVFPTAQPSLSQAISDDGRYVVFSSGQPNLVIADEADQGIYVYVRDVLAGSTTRVSHGIMGHLMGNAAISGDGRYIVYPSIGVPGEQTALRRYDQRTGKTRVIAVSSTPGNVSADWYTVAISDNGRSVVYTRTVTADGGVTWTTRMYRYDASTRATTELVPGGLGRAGDPYLAIVPSLSANGRYVSYVQATELGQRPTPYELVRLDTTTGTRLVIDTSTPLTIHRNAFSDPSLSNSGRFLTYHDLDVAGVPNVYLYDANTGNATLVSHTAAGLPSVSGAGQPQVSGDGRYVTFSSSATDLVEGTPATTTIYVWDRYTDTVETIVRNLQGAYPASSSARSTVPYIDGDGGTVAFTSRAQNLVAGAVNRLERVYVWQR